MSPASSLSSVALLLVACSTPREPPAPPRAEPVAVAAPVPVSEDISPTPRPRTEEELQEALARDVHDAGAWEELARLHLARSRERPAARLLAERVVAAGLAALARRDLHSVDLLLTRAQLALDAGAPLRAREDLEAAVLLDPTSAPALRRLARLCLDMRSFARARDVLAALSEQAQGRDDPDVWLALGVAERGVGNLRAAEDDYHRAAKLDRADPRPFYNLGLLYHRLALQRRTDARERQQVWLVARGHFQRSIALSRDRLEFERLRASAREYIDVYEANFPAPPGDQRVDPAIAALAAEAEAVMWLEIDEAERGRRLRELAEQADELLCRRFNLQCESERRRLLELERRAFEEEAARR